MHMEYQGRKLMVYKLSSVVNMHFNVTSGTEAVEQGWRYIYKHYNTDTALCINSRNVGSGMVCVVIPVLGLILVSFPDYMHIL